MYEKVWITSVTRTSKGPSEMVRDNKCSNYPRFELTSDFYKDILEKVQEKKEIV